MLYMVSLKSSNKLANAPVEVIEKLRKGIASALSEGHLKSACVKVGGGMVLIVDSPSNQHLTQELRKHHITDAEVVPLVPLVAFLDAHIEFKKTGTHEV